MKKLLLAFVAISFISCSDDDTNNNTVNKDLNEITTFFEGEKVEWNKFENNRLTKRYLYNANGEVFIDDQYVYDAQGRLATRTIVSEGETNTQTFEYDESGRLELINTETPAYTSEREFNYSLPNKIISTDHWTSEGGESTHITTFDVDQQGRVFRITHGDVVNFDSMSEAVYEGNNVIQYSNTTHLGLDNELVTTTIDYTYNLEIPVRGDYLNKEANMFGNNNVNAILFYGTFAVEVDGYMVHYTNGISNTVIAREFDNEGFPVKIIYLNDEHGRVIEISYQ